ncbi:Lsr2 family DNA-binding protein [Kitasatospora sp. P5_F3]
MTIAALRALIDSALTDTHQRPASTGGPSTVDTQTAVAVSMYRDGETVPVITRATGLTQDQIGAAVAASGTLFVAGRTDSTPPPASTAGPTRSLTPAELITWGMQHDSPRMHRLADQARTALADLQQAQRRAAVVAAAEAQVQQARQQLADAEQALRSAKGTRAATVPAGPKPDRAMYGQIRAWASENGHRVAVAGVIPRHVVDAYHAAQEASRAA